MAVRGWGGTWASFYELDNIVSGMPVSYGGVNQFNSIVDNSAEWRRVLSGIGSGRVTLYAVNNWEQFVVPGRVCIVHKNVSGYAAIVSRLITCFLIENVEPGVRGGLNVVTLSGPGVESLLTKRPVFGPVGQETIYSTTLAAAADAPRTSSLNDPAAEGSDVAVIVDDTGIDKDDEIRIRLGAANDGDWHVAYVTQVNPPDTAAGTIQFSPAQPAAAAEGNSVEIRTAGLSLASVANLAVGHRVEITLDNATVFETTIRRIDSPLSAIFIQEGLTSIASSGKAVAAYDYSGLATDDVTQIMQHAPGWTMTFETGNGTAAGTAHDPVDESVFDLLHTTAERTGEMFRYRVLAAGLPTYRLDWRRTPDDSGVYFIMYAPDEHDRQLADEDDIGKASIKSLKSRRSRRLITRVYPKPGDGVISLRYCTPQAVTNAIVDGFGIYVSDDFYEPDYVELTADVAEYGVHAITENYSDISVVVGNPHGLTAAADQLLASAIQTLYQAASQFEFTIEAYSPSLIHPGQFVHIENETGTEPASDAVNTFTVLETTEKLVDGRPHTTLIVANHTNYRRTPAAAVATLIRSLRQTQRRISARAAGEGTTTIVTGGGGGGTETTDHGLLTGLTDDDHPQYLLASGARALAGNLAVNAGITVDGVDISAHAANANAHHAAVTVQDASLSLTVQALRVADAFAGAGLSLTGGIATVNTATASGTTLSGDTVAVVPSSTGGVQLTAAGVALKTPANSGLQVDASGAALSPSTLSATTTNALSGAGHTHAVTATDNAKTTTGTLLKGSPAGDLTARWLTADKLITPLVETAAGTLTLNPAAGKTINNGNLEFTGARSITTDTGSLTLAPAQTLVLDPADDVVRVNPTTTLRSSHAAVGVFPQTGWQIDYDGHGYFTSLLADELHVQSFIADIMRVKVGGEYIPESMALIRRDMTIPAVGATATLYVEDIPGWGNIAAFAENDWVLLRIVSRAGGGLIVASAWGQVTGYNDLPDGEQSWTFTTRVATTAVGQRAMTGDIALDYGKVGSSWWYVTVLDPGGPHAGFASWYGSYPGDNPEYWLRMGQLKGVSGTFERGFQTGKSTSSFTRFSELRNEIHGSRLSLYAGDGGRMQVSAVEVVFYRTGSQSSTLVPDGDGTAVNVETTAGNYWSAVDEGTGAPNHGDYITNRANLSGSVFLSLTNPASFSSIFRVDIKAALKTTGLANDTVHIFGQVFAGDEATPLTGEVLLVTRTTNTTATVTVVTPHVGYGTGGAVVADWNGARLRLRWEYDINANEEAIRLDPAVPSLAVGNPLPTGLTTGGPGLWAGLESGAYQARIGDALGARLTYDGNALKLVSGSTGAAIDLNPTMQSIALGNPLPTGTQAGGAGFWVGLLSGSNYGLRIGGAYQVGPQLLYDGTVNSLALRRTDGTEIIKFAGDGSSSFAGPMTIGAAGGIWQGTGTFASPTTGLKIWNSGGKGVLATYGGGVKQVSIDTDGKLVIGEYGITLDKDGMTVFPNGDWTPGDAGIRFLTPGGDQFAKLYNYSGTGFMSVVLHTEVAGHTAGWAAGTHATGAQTNVTLYADDTVFKLSSDYSYALLSNADLLVRERGIAVGYPTTSDLNRGQIASDLNGEHNYNALVLKDTGVVAHGMTSLVGTENYGTLGKAYNAVGGLKVGGYSDDIVGISLQAAGVNTNNVTSTAAIGAVTVNVLKRSGAGPATTSLATNDNAFVIQNSAVAKFIVKANGDFYYDGTGAAYDDRDDVELLRTLSRETWDGTIESTWDKFITYNRQHLIDAGILSAGNFINGAALNRLLVGAIGQLAGRVKQMEAQLGYGTD